MSQVGEENFRQVELAAFLSSATGKLFSLSENYYLLTLLPQLLEEKKEVEATGVDKYIQDVKHRHRQAITSLTILTSQTFISR